MNETRARHTLLHLVRTLTRENPDTPTLEAARVVLTVLSDHHPETFQELGPLAVNEIRDLKLIADDHDGPVIGEGSLDTEAVYAYHAVSKMHAMHDEPDWHDILAHFLAMLEDGVWPEPSELDEG